MNVAIYARKSKATKKGESISNQIELCKKYFLNTTNENVNFFIYEDEGWSGGNINRPQFTKMMNDAKLKRFSALICYRLDRIARNVADFSSTYKILEESNIAFISITEQFDTSTIMGRAMINISATFAQIERETIAERIKDNMLELSRTGRWLGGTPPLGFKSVQITENNKRMYKLEVVEEEIEIVRLIYKLYPEYKSTVPIARYLVSNYIKGKNGGDFSRNTVLQILKNPVYCCSDENAIKYFESKGSTLNCSENNKYGLMVYNKRKGGKKENPIEEWIIATGKHPGIIPGAEWVECQNILSEISSKTSPRKATGNKFLLSGMLKLLHLFKNISLSKSGYIFFNMGTSALTFKYSLNPLSASTTPNFSLSCTSNFLLSFPKIFICPSSRLIKPRIALNKVLFPAPLAPMIPVILPGAIFNEHSSLKF